MIQVNSLVIEVTRRCNMNCDHCMRGDAENVDIFEDVLDTVARTMRAYTVTFSGGEPSLNVGAIRRYFEQAERYGTLPSSFYVVTNGKENCVELAMALLNAYSLVDEPEMCGLAMSEDPFHDDVDGHNRQFFEGLSFYRQDEKRFSRTDFAPRWVISTGRAANNGLGPMPGLAIAKSLEEIVEECSVQSDVLPVDAHIDSLYISANGNIVDICDVSYDDIDSHLLCHISELDDRLRELAKAREEVA